MINRRKGAETRHRASGLDVDGHATMPFDSSSREGVLGEHKSVKRRDCTSVWIIVIKETLYFGGSSFGAIYTKGEGS